MTCPTPVTWQTAEIAASPVAIVLPAMGVQATFYAPFADELNQSGLHTAVADLRGQGQYLPRPNRHHDHGFFELVAEDLPKILTAARQRYPRSPLLLIGHSLGGHVATLHAGTATGNPGVSGLITIGADSPYFRAFGPKGPVVLTKAHMAAAVAQIHGYLPTWAGLGAQPKTLLSEWARLSLTGRYRIERLPQISAGIAASTTPVLAISINGDPIAPGSSVDHLSAMFQNAPVERMHYTDERARLDHFRWVKVSYPIVEHIRDWWDRIQACQR